MAARKQRSSEPTESRARGQSSASSASRSSQSRTRGASSPQASTAGRSRSGESSSPASARTSSRQRGQTPPPAARYEYTPTEGDRKKQVGTEIYSELDDRVNAIVAHAQQTGIPRGIRSKSDVFNFLVWLGVETIEQENGGPWHTPRALRAGRRPR